MAGGAFTPISRAVSARMEGRTPATADLAVCQNHRGSDDLACWNGKNSLRPWCGDFGSQNIPVHARTGLGDWIWIAHLARLWKDEGLFGRELGAPGVFYYGGILDDLALACRQLGEHPDAEDCRLAIRAALAWDALVAIPAPRRFDRVDEGGHVRESRVDGKTLTRNLSVPVAGNRWTVKRGGAGGMLSEDSHAEQLANYIGAPPAWLANNPRGILTQEERHLLVRTVDGDPVAALKVSAWLFGVIDTPEVKWRWRLRRTSEGSESVFFGPWPNPHKPCRTVTQARIDGTHTGMRPAPRYARKGWAKDYAVGIDGGVIHAICAHGAAALPELGGTLLWQVDVEGSGVKFIAAGGNEQ